MDTMGIAPEHLLGICIGVGLAASCGFRIFVPLLITSIAAYAGDVQLAAGFEWIATPEAITAFAVATLLEVGGYYIPWVDNFLDTIGTPAAGIAGTILATSMITDTSPFLQWSLGIIVGGGTATVTHVAFAALRGASSAITGGLGNPVVSTIENVGAFILSLLAIVVPLLVIGLILAGAVVVIPRLPQSFRWIKRKLFRQEEDDLPPPLPKSGAGQPSAAA